MGEAAHRLHHLVMDFVRECRLLEPEWTGDGEDGALSLSQAFALHELTVAGAMSQGELAERLHLDKSAASRMAAALERRGLLLRERHSDNRRLYRLRLTEAGRRAHSATVVAADDSFERLARALTAEELDSALTGLSALVRAVREVREEQAGEPSPAPPEAEER